MKKDPLLSYIDKRLQSVDFALWFHDRRLSKLEKMARILRAGHTRIYNWHYAKVKRRKGLDVQMMRQAKEWSTMMRTNRVMFNKLVAVANQMKKGRHLMLLSGREYRLLKYYLSGRRTNKEA